MLKFKTNKGKLIMLGTAVLAIFYVIFKTFHQGADINVYLHASKQLFNGENIYSNNPYNNYLYSPLFAILLRPLSILKFEYARVIWGLINLVLTYRIWVLTKEVFRKIFDEHKKMIQIWTMAIAFVMINILNHNLILGQVTILIFWLTFEGIMLVFKGSNWKGALLIALGINFKIIPLLALFYLFFKGKYKAVAISTVFVICTLILPALFIGMERNNELLVNWKDAINPTNEKYVFENNPGCHSINELLPAYLYDYEGDADIGKYNLKRRIFSVPADVLSMIINILRVVFLLSLFAFIFYKWKKREPNSLYIFWEFSYMGLISTLIFPHQMTYSMLYLAPAMSYMIVYIILVYKIKWKIPTIDKIMVIISMFILISFALMIRDVIGKYLMYITRFYHFISFYILFSMIFLYRVKPDKLLQLNQDAKTLDIQ